MYDIRLNLTTAEAVLLRRLSLRPDARLGQSPTMEALGGKLRRAINSAELEAFKRRKVEEQPELGGEAGGA